MGSGRRIVVKDPARYKTQLCANFSASGHCPYGRKCQFAHGTSELIARKGTQAEACEAQAQAPVATAQQWTAPPPDGWRTASERAGC